MTTQNNSGSINYTPRAIRQDTLDAMRGDIVIGLIEFITNSDDAYRKNKITGDIDIELVTESKPFKYSVLVRDRAGGLSGEDLKDKFINIGKENTDNIGLANGDEGTRGLFGRGAKDVAVFGKAYFATIHHGLFSSLEIDGFTWTYSNLVQNVAATDDHYSELGLKKGESGFNAKVFVSESRATTFPNTKKLAENLSNHVALRGINENHRVTFRDARANQTAVLKSRIPEGKIIIDQDVEIKGYPQKGHLKIIKLNERQSGDCDEYSLHGVIIKDHKTNFQNTFLDLKSRPEIGWFSGELVCPQIDSLNREFDDNENSRENADLERVAKNPLRLAKKSRDGLDKKHPYYRSLTIVLNEHLKPFMDEIAKEENADQEVSKDLQKKLDDVSRSLAQLLQDALDEEELDGDFDGGTGPDDSELTIVPPIKVIEKGNSGTLNLWVPEFDFDPAKISVSLVDSKNFRIIDSGSVLEFRKHATRPIYQASIKIEALEYATSELQVDYRNIRAQAKITCIPEIPDPKLMIDTLTWEKDHSSIVPMKKRILNLYAPVSMHKEKVNFSSEGTSVTLEDQAEFRLAKSRGYCIAKVAALSGREEGLTKLFAQSGGLIANSDITVREINPNKGPNIKIDLKDQDSVTRSSLLPLPGLLSIQIYLKHKAMRKILGSHDGTRYVHIDSWVVKAVISEIVATELANYVIEIDFAKKPHLYRDPASLIRKQKELTTRFNVAMQASLLAEFVN